MSKQKISCKCPNAMKDADCPERVIEGGVFFLLLFTKSHQGSFLRK